MIRTISLEEVEYVAFRLAREHLAFDEPIPDFQTRFSHRLESCLLTPFMSFGGKSPYPSLVSKAAMLLYLMIKNHPFQNGNKRLAVTTLLVFLHKNGKWLRVEPHEFYEFTVWVARSPPELKDATVKGAEDFIRAHLVNISPSRGQ
ncbi:MAG TPA: type II toxin-antitoxin system death-on-curing family toxin [Sedimentisphaerales bacterium]|nr:type II toxin-antitoxin system death-on-curing family toxin [Sedimentisphaerales bacterium]HRS11470.1 type II toxin-antitoxin system death-on-curing family toxin [Sedimentisphaerales bacterium]HRV47992.1 type II toxin-antitoxin system death-on-curing family toxin [Sedimentisphaerales bacterium]